MRLSNIGKRAAAMVVTMIAAAVLVPLAAVAPAQAAPNAATGWTPQVYPLLAGETVNRDISSADRNRALALCGMVSGFACVSVGQGDGKHTLFHLYRCETRTLANFIDALAVLNSQTGGAVVRFWGPNKAANIPADGRIYTVSDSATYDFNRLDIC